ncbi:MAG: PilZ domain-containing protein [Proteobacteria bacterium]|nr:PilZ domain-containing protein [Pseudomonadota bacterium]
MNREVKKKRIFSRGALQVRARCRLKNRQRKCYMTNLSEGGCLIYCYSSAAISAGETLEISFRLNNASEEIVVEGTVARAMPFNRGTQDINYTLGIRFSDLAEKQKKAIVNFIHQYLADMRQDQTVS